MSKKTERKNKTNLNLVWPTAPFFTIEELQTTSTNVDIINITLRVKLSKKIDDGIVAEIGCKTGGQGRPKKVFALTPVPQTTLDLARSQNITLVDKVKLQALATKTPVVTNIVAKTEPVVA